MYVHKKIDEYISSLGYEPAGGYSDKKKILLVGVLLILVFFGGLITLVLGAYNISLPVVYQTIFTHITGGSLENITKLHNTIIWDIRLPRVLLAITVGGALAIAGAVFQSVFRNPLVEPYILGVSSGAAFGAALGIVYSSFFFSIQLSAFLFSILAVVSAYSLARVRGQTPLVTLILAGVIIASVFSAGVSFLNYTATNTQMREIIFWLMGGFYYASWADVELLTPVVFICLFILWSFSWKLNVLSMGDDEARALGVNPEKSKAIVILLATLITAVSVSMVGIVAWIGLMMPHASRMIFGPDNRFVIPSCFLMGSLYLLICDTIARTLTMSEIPIGIITSLLGAPYLCYLIRNRGNIFLGDA